MDDTLLVTNTSPRAVLCGAHVLAPNRPTPVPLDFFVQFSGHQHIVFDWSRMKDTLQSHTEDGRLLVDWHSPLSAVDGYGRHAIFLVRALFDAGVHVQVRGSWAVDPIFMPADISQMRRQYASAMPAKMGFAYTLGYDPMLFTHESIVKIGLTQFETTRLPRKHVENVNKLDHCLVTSSFQVPMFRKSGVEVPMSVVTPAVDVDYFTVPERPMDGLFKVLIMGALTPRKDPVGAIGAFVAASQGNPDWRLTVKTRRVTHLDDIERAVAADPRITLIVRDDPPDGILQMFHEHDAFLWPSKGEGMGLPPLEAMATGMEVICADNSGMKDFVGRDHSWPIRNGGMDSAVGDDAFSLDYVRAYGDVGQWWRPDLDHAAHQLERCFSAWREGRGKGPAAAAYVREHHTAAHAAADIVKVLEHFA